MWNLWPALLCAVTISYIVDASTLTPPILPLIVRNPYLSTWLQDVREAPWNRWPMFWTGESLGFSVMAATPKNGFVFPLLGRPHDSLVSSEEDNSYNVSFPGYKGAKYDASTTNLTYFIPAPSSINGTNGVEIILSFLSPITPTSTLRQAVPASYLTVHVKGDTDVDVYVDINGQWVSGDRGSRINWSLYQKMIPDGKGLKTLSFQRETEQLLTEINDRSEWGTLHFTAPIDVDHEVGASSRLRHQFAKVRRLHNNVDSRFRSIMDDEPVFAFSKSFSLSGSSSSSDSDSVTFTIAHIQDPVVQFAAARGLTLMRPLWKSYFSSEQDLLTFHYYDFRNAVKLSDAYSEALGKDAFASGAEDYKDIVALSARQVLGATSFAGTPENPILFLKEISSNGNFQTIDVIFPSFPFFLYTNPRWLAYLLEPLIEHMLSGQYPNTYAMHDLGAHFPNATGHPDGRDEYMPVEECGNILIMGLALVNSLIYDTGSAAPLTATVPSKYVESKPDESVFPLMRDGEVDGIEYIDDNWGGSTKGLKQAQKWVERSYSLWKQWTGYLVEFSLQPSNQLCTDDFAGWLALQTNLALKGIIGIKAMAGIAKTINFTDEAQRYEDIAREYISKWEGFGMSRDGTHAKLAYDWYGSWTTIYNLFADALLCFHLENSTQVIDPDMISEATQELIGSEKSKKAQGFVPRHIYTKQSTWYHFVRQTYGLPLDSRHLYTKSDWEFFAAAVASQSTRKEILQSVAKWVNETVTDRPFTDLYKTEGDGGFPGPNFFARPVIGGHFAFLTLERACGGKAMDGLKFLDEAVDAQDADRAKVAAQEFLAAKIPKLDL